MHISDFKKYIPSRIPPRNTPLKSTPRYSAGRKRWRSRRLLARIACSVTGGAQRVVKSGWSVTARPHPHNTFTCTLEGMRSVRHGVAQFATRSTKHLTPAAGANGEELACGAASISSLGRCLARLPISASAVTFAPRSRAFRARIDNTPAVLFSRSRHEKRFSLKFSERSKRMDFVRFPFQYSIFK